MKKIKHLIYRLKYLYGRQLRLSKPVDISLELSSHCNMRCEYCYHSDQDNLPFAKDHMSKETIERIIWDGAKYGVNAIKFNWKGESTINPHYKYAAQTAEALSGGSTYIDRMCNSNFKFPNEKDDIFIALKSMTKIKVSFDSFTKSFFEKQRAGGDWDLTYRNIDKFYREYFDSDKQELIIQMVRTKANLNERFEEMVYALWPKAKVSIRDVVEGRVENDVSEYTHRDRDNSLRVPCKQAFVRIIFNTKGEAFPCCPDTSEQLKIGDIYQDDINEIFNGVVARNLREDLKSGLAFENDPCKDCSSYETYKGYKPSFFS